MKEYPQLKTERLLLGKILASDIPKIVEYAGNIKIAQNTLNMPHPYAEKDAIFWLNLANEGFANKTKYIFGIRNLATNEFMGGIGIHVNARFNHGELGYWLAEPFWNNGYMSEAVKALLHFGFITLDLHKIFATHLVENPASGKVMIKNGMIKEAELKEHYKKGDEYKSVIQLRLTRKEYENI